MVEIRRIPPYFVIVALHQYISMESNNPVLIDHAHFIVNDKVVTSLHQTEAPQIASNHNNVVPIIAYY